MSFGFSVGDFLAVGNLCMKLYRSFKDVPDTFDEIGRELASFYIVVCDLEHQASDPDSLLNRRGASRKDELLQLRDNLTFTMEELERLFQTYTRIGRSAWRRIQLSQKDLEQPRRDLLFHMTAINGFVSSLTMGAIGRMEQSLQNLETLVREFLLRDRGRAQTLRSEAPGNEETWDLLRITLASENIVLEEHDDEVRTVIESVMKEESLGSERRWNSDSSRSQHEVFFTEQSRRDTNLYGGRGTKGEKQRKNRAAVADKVPRAAAPSDISQEAKVMSVLHNNGFDFGKYWKQPLFKFVKNKLLAPDVVDDAPEFRALDWSAKNGYVKGVRFLLENGVSLQAQNREYNPRPALVQAASCGYTEIVSLLVKYGASTEAVCIPAYDRWDELDNLTALQVAAKKGHIDIVRVLLKHGPNFDLMDDRGWTPLCMAVHEGHVEIIRALLTKGASTKSTAKKESLLHIAAEANRPEVVRLLLEYGEDPMKMFEGKTPLDAAIFGNYVSVAKELPERAAHADGKHSLELYPHRIVTLDKSGDRSQLLEMLLEFGVDVDCYGIPPETTLYRAICEDKEQMVEILLRHGASLTLAWLIAVSRKNETVMKKTISMGVDLRAKDSDGIDGLGLMTIHRRPLYPLISIPSRGGKMDLEGLHLLCTLGLQLGGPDNYGGKALLYVAGKGDLKAVRLLIEKGVKFDNTTKAAQELLSGAVSDPPLPSRVWLARKDILVLLQAAAMQPKD